jgi:hypothetical protein
MIAGIGNESIESKAVTEKIIKNNPIDELTWFIKRFLLNERLSFLKAIIEPAMNSQMRVGNK